MSPSSRRCCGRRSLGASEPRGPFWSRPNKRIASVKKADVGEIVVAGARSRRVRDRERIERKQKGNRISEHTHVTSAMSLTLQGRAKLMELSLVTHVPSGPIGCAWAGHFAWQK